MTTLRAAAAAIVLVTSLGACGSDPATTESAPSATSTADTDSSPSASSADPRCRLSADELSHITGTEQTIEVSEASDDEVNCEAPQDAQGIETQWFLITPPGGSPVPHRKQGSNLRKLGLDVVEVDLGSGVRGWLGTGPGAVPAANLVANVDGKELHVAARTSLTDEGMQELTATYATEVARAYIAAGQD